VVTNHKGWLPGEQMYLSGAPLHALAIQLLAELDAGLPGVLQLGTRQEGVPVAFSAGIDRENFSTAVGLGLAPVTICSDLLKPGGYGRLAPMLRRLERDMQASGCSDLDSWRTHHHEQALAGGHPHAVAAYAAELAAAEGGKRYSHAATAKPPRSVSDELQIWDCCCCNLCVTVCPNDAMLRLPTPETRAGALAESLDKEWQYVCLAELCNACGNCTTFCPEQGEPFRDKPRLYLHAQRFDSKEPLAFLVRSAELDGTGSGSAGSDGASSDGASSDGTGSDGASSKGTGSNGKHAFAVEAGVAPPDAAAILTVLCNQDSGLPFRSSDLPAGT
jgi:putative selenate reductase